MCSPQYFGPMDTGWFVAKAISIIFWLMPFVCISIGTRRPHVATPSNTVFQKSKLPSATPLSP